jgi:hypothetical protein
MQIQVRPPEKQAAATNSNATAKNKRAGETPTLRKATSTPPSPAKRNWPLQMPGKQHEPRNGWSNAKAKPIRMAS